MPDFVYIARDPLGEKVTGKIAAANRIEALSLLDAKQLFPVEVDMDMPARSLTRLRRISANDRAVMYWQLADLLESGVPLLRSLSIIIDQSSRPALVQVLDEIFTRVEQGATLADAMAQHEQLFGSMAISIIRAGGEGGFLEQSLRQVADFTEKQQDLRMRTIGALAYPVFLAIFGFVVVTVLVVFFVPRFSQLFEALRQRGELPLLTQGLLAVSNTLGSIWGLGILAAIVAACVALRIKLATQAGRLWRDRFFLRLKFLGTIFRNLAIARFCRVLGTLLKNGVPIIRSIEISSHAAGNRVLAGAIEDSAKNIAAGQSLAGPLAACGEFPPAVVEMIAVAEEANNLETVLINIADSLERRTWRRLELTVRFIEPIMLIILAGIVLVIILALVMPILKMSMTV